MIEKHVHSPDDIECEPAFSTEHLDAYLLRAPKGFDADTHIAVLDTYICYERGEEYYSPKCAVYVEHCKYRDGRVLNRILKCDVGSFGVVPSSLANTIRSDAALMESFKSNVESNTTECLLGIQEFAGPVTLAYADIEEFKTEFATEALFYELNDQLLLAAAAGNQQPKQNS